MKVCIFIVLAFLCITNAVAETGYYVEQERCPLGGRPSAFELGDKIAYGDPIAYEYQFILEDEFSRDEIIEPLYIAYGLYIIAEKIGDKRGAPRQRWAESYLDRVISARVDHAIDMKYSYAHLQRCFSINGVVKENNKTINQNSNYLQYLWSE